jgi:hypothetical protein
MRFVSFIVTAVLVVFGVTACGSGNVATKTVTVTANPTSLNQEYCKVVFNGTTWPKTDSECHELVLLGHAVCDALNRGVKFDVILQTALEGYNPFQPLFGWSMMQYAKNYGDAEGAAVAAFCPQFNYQVQAVA